MAKVKYSANALRDLDRIYDFLAGADAEQAQEAHHAIVESIEFLSRHPLLGRAVEDGLRELVIARGKTGYVALYRFREEEELALILTIRHQRELKWND